MNKSMLKNHLLMTPGPTQVPKSIANAMIKPLIDHRSQTFQDFILPLFDNLKTIFKTKDGSILLFPGSGSAGWEAALVNTLSPGDQVLVPVYGEFSSRWADFANKLGFSVNSPKAEWSESAPVEPIFDILKKDIHHQIKAILIVHNETSTGVVSNIKSIRDALTSSKHPALLMVDGISSIAGIDFCMDDWGVDIALCGSQKCFMMPPGLALIGVSKKAVKFINNSDSKRAYFDFRAMLPANTTGYFPYTPPISLLYGLRESIDLILREGLSNVFMRHQLFASAVRCAINGWGLDLLAKSSLTHSNTVSAVVVPKGFNANDVIQYAFHRYNLSLGSGLSHLSDTVFRIGHLGAIDENITITALRRTELALYDAKIISELETGVRAARNFLNNNSTTVSI